MKHEYRYAKKQLDLCLSITWGMIALINFVMVVFILKFAFDMPLIAILPLMQALLSLALCRLFALVYNGSRAYLIIENGYIYKDQGLIRSKKMFKLSDIRNSIILGDKLRLSSNNRTEFHINLSCILVDDIYQLKEVLQIKL